MESMSSTVTCVDANQRSLVPRAWDYAVRKLSVDECASAGRSLAYAFATDPLSHYLLDGEDMAGFSEEYKWKLHNALMNTVVASHAFKGVVTTVGPDNDALAIW